MSHLGALGFECGQPVVKVDTLRGIFYASHGESGRQKKSKRNGWEKIPICAHF